MKAVQIMPISMRRELKQLGEGISIARRRRRISQALMLERTGLAKSTYQRVEKGDGSVAIAAYAMSLFALGLSNRLGSLADPTGDEVAFLLDAERLPKRVARARDGR